MTIILVGEVVCARVRHTDDQFSENKIIECANHNEHVAKI